MKKLLIFIVIFLALDFFIGTTVEYLFFKTYEGENGGVINLILKKNTDILIMGSSRAKHHYIPSILAKGFSGKTIFNAGVNGQHFYFSYLLLDLVLKNYVPQVILLNVDEDTFKFKEDEKTRLSVFSYYVDKSVAVKRLLHSRSPFERIKYLSKTYLANYKVLSIIKNIFRKTDMTFDGYIPLSGVLNESDMVSEINNDTPIYQNDAPFFDKEKVEYLGHFLFMCEERGIIVYLVYSPRFFNASSYREKYEALHSFWKENLLSIIQKYENTKYVEVSNYTHPDTFSSPYLYKDSGHLNHQGAEVFTSLLLTELTKPDKKESAIFMSQINGN